MSNYNVMLVSGEPQWTAKAFHLACAMARSNSGRVTLVKMVAVGHPILLGSPEGSRYVSHKEMAALTELAATADRYGVPVHIAVCQFANYANALVDAAEQLDAAAVFAALPASHIPFWSRFQQWRVERSLARSQRSLHTLEQAGGSLEWTPSATQTMPVGPAPRSEESKA